MIDNSFNFTHNPKIPVCITYIGVVEALSYVVYMKKNLCIICEKTRGTGDILRTFPFFLPLQHNFFVPSFPIFSVCSHTVDRVTVFCLQSTGSTYNRSNEGLNFLSFPSRYSNRSDDSTQAKVCVVCTRFTWRKNCHTHALYICLLYTSDAADE